MKMTKKVCAFTMALLMAGAAFAADGIDGLTEATAYTVDDDSTYALNLLDWNKIEFEKYFGVIELDSENTGNLAGAYKLGNGNAIHAFWNGNLWAEDGQNLVSAMYGFKNMAVKGTVYKGTTSITDDTGLSGSTDPVSFGVKGLGAGFGMNINEKLGFTVEAGYAWAELELGTYDFDYSMMKGSASIRYILTNEEATYSYVSATLSDTYGATKVDESGVDLTLYTNELKLTPKFKFEHKFTPTFTYGFTGLMPCSFGTSGLKGDVSHSNDSVKEVDFIVNNGFVAQVKPTVAIAAGISTQLPAIYYTGSDRTNGDYKNTFFAGCAINVTPNFRLDVCANIKPTEDDDAGSNGESLNEIWEQGFAISASFKL